MFIQGFFVDIEENFVVFDGQPEAARRRYFNILKFSEGFDEGGVFGDNRVAGV